MTKKEFFDLIEKYNNNICSKEEEDVLFQYCKQVQVDDISKSWSLSKEERLRVKILSNIHSGVSDQNKRRNKIRKIKKASRIAAVFIGLLVSSYFFLFYFSKSETIALPENVITLELEDGTIKTIKENDTLSVFNQNGNLMGYQTGNQLVYDQKETSDKLAYNTLTVPYGKRFELHLSDGTRAHLNAGSSLTYPVQFLEGKDREVFITGEAYLDVAKDKNHPFIVHVENFNIRVLGTQFNVLAYPEDETSEVVLVEGSVGLYDSTQVFDTTNSTMMTPGNKATFSKESGKIQVKPVVIDVYTAWRNGELVFRDMTFENILKKLERYYGVTIINLNKNLSNKEFNASFGAVPIEKVLDGLKDVYGLTYKIENKKITIE
ncbi:FecR family protein [Zobellia uliginosa]|uniref:FecR family protein n=1 Tax=Zobellia uliginosa TaxID=143224 RepID=A0ABY1KKS8_9FLAO|nr:FecR domain-containing protein [Zobellia uliginosa]SIS46453.1 FecR family protein [Zobellia uliginosa]